MRSKLNQANIDNSDPAKYPNGRIKDNTGAGDGTPVNEEVYGDFHEMKDKLMRLYGLQFNGLPDNETNGYQFVDALRALSNKNDIVLPLTLDPSGGGSNNLSIGLKLGFLLINESFYLKSSVNVPTGSVSLKGIDNVSKTVTSIGSVKVGDYVRMINISTGILMIRAIDSSNIDSIVSDFGYLKGATQSQEDAGESNEVATTPLVNLTTFAKRVIGSLSGNYLSSPSRNGLMSQSDKAKLDALQANASGEERRGFFVLGDVNTGSVGQNYQVSGQITQAQITQRTNNGQVVRITINPPLPDLAYFVRQQVESASTNGIEGDNDIKAPIFRKINTSTFEVYYEETAGTAQNLRIHLQAIKS